MRLTGGHIRLRALEPDDVETMYRWENDPAVWSVSGTTAPFSRYTLRRFIREQAFDLYTTRQLRLVIEVQEEPAASNAEHPGRITLTGGSVPTEDAVAESTVAEATYPARPATADDTTAAAPSGTAIMPADTPRNCAAQPAADLHSATTCRGTLPPTAASPAALPTAPRTENSAVTVPEKSASSAPQAAELQRVTSAATPHYRPVGALDLFEFDPHDLRCGVGILIHAPADRGRGYAGETLDLLLTYARDVLGLHQLWCDVEAGNAASLALFRRAGFTESGRKRHWRRTPQGWQDVILLQRLLD